MAGSKYIFAVNKGEESSYLVMSLRTEFERYDRLGSNSNDDDADDYDDTENDIVDTLEKLGFFEDRECVFELDEDIDIFATARTLDATAEWDWSTEFTEWLNDREFYDGVGDTEFVAPTA